MEAAKESASSSQEHLLQYRYLCYGHISLYSGNAQLNILPWSPWCPELPGFANIKPFNKRRKSLRCFIWRDGYFRDIELVLT